jgi:hypothetical protein
MKSPQFNTAMLAIASLLLLTASPAARAGESISPPTLPSPLCDSVAVPAGNSVKVHAYAVGVQIYRWDGTAWVFVAPAAMLFSDSGHHGQVGIHYAGPTWESKSGSKVVGTRLASCTPDSSTIAWLKLGAVSTDGPGVFNRVTFIQRVNTAGGTAPSAPGTTVGQEANVPYTAEYYFYGADDVDD